MKYYVVRTRIKEMEYANKGLVAVGWSDFNFSNYIGHSDDLIAEVDRKYYQETTSPQSAGRSKAEIRRFVGIAPGDIIVTPCYRGFMISRSTGKYEYDGASYDEDLSNQLRVDFLKNEEGKPIIFTRKGKNLGLVSKLKAPGFAVLSIDTQPIINEINELVSTKKDLSGAYLVQERESQELSRFRDDIRKVLSEYEMSYLSAGGDGFEELLVSLLRTDGYETRKLSKKIGKGKADADILAVKESGLCPEFTSVLYIQAKHHSGLTNMDGLNQLIDFRRDIESESVHEFLLEEGSQTINSRNVRYVLISSGRFSPEVRMAAEESGITLIDGDLLAKMLFDKIDELDEIRFSLGFYKKYNHIIHME